MSDSAQLIPFSVDLPGLIEIMGSSLYSRPDTPIRELLQNAHDAVMRRRQSDLTFQGRIDVRQDPERGALSFTDNGVGLTWADAQGYLGTLGASLTGALKRQDRADSPGGDLIGQFGIGLFSAFMLAEKIIVESRSEAENAGLRWSAGVESQITLERIDRDEPGSTVTLILKPNMRFLALQPTPVEKAIREHADFLPVPIFLNQGSRRVNLIHADWFEPSPDRESVELALQEQFDEAPLDVILLRQEKPVSIAGALYVTPQRIPGFSERATVMVTVRRMIISRKIPGLLPDWASFLRGCLELIDCAPTTSREDLVRNATFEQVRKSLEARIFEHFEQLAVTDPARLEAIINWHRYTFAGAAIENARLRKLLLGCYRLPTSQGPLTLLEIFERSAAESPYGDQAERVVWYNTDRRQERWINELFQQPSGLCVHTFRSFEESLLAQCVNDENAARRSTDLRLAHPGAPHFAEAILGIAELEPVEDPWPEHFASCDVKVSTGRFRADQPVVAFLNEGYELVRSFEEMKQRGEIPSGFQRLIDKHFRHSPVGENEVILNRNHPLVARALTQNSSAPLASVLRLMVQHALQTAGATADENAQQTQQADLAWIAECLWGRGN